MAVDPSDPADLRPPTLSLLLGEARTPLQLARLTARAPQLLRAPRAQPGRERTVVVIPGLWSNDGATAPLRAYLRRLGHRPSGWGLGLSRGDVERRLPEVTATVERLAEASGGPVDLLGWSLGGTYAREVARERPELVRRLVTYGTPVVGGPAYTSFARRFSPSEIERVAAQIERASRKPIMRPLTAVFSRRDGVVAWRACLDERTPGAEHVEVSSTHTGMGLDPDVWRIVVDALAEDVG